MNKLLGFEMDFWDNTRYRSVAPERRFSPDGGLTHTENMFQLNIRWGLHEAILRALISPFAETK